jgi:hypothetical protein
MKWFIIFCFSVNFIFGQSGGRKNETSMGVKKYGKSPATSPWVYKKTEVGEIQENELIKLFKWTITPNRKEYRKIQDEQRKQRDKYRIRGNEVFHKRKYNF